MIYKNECNGRTHVMKYSVNGGKFPWSVYKKREWCSKNAIGLWAWEIDVSHNEIFYFEIESDAVLFKLMIT